MIRTLAAHLRGQWMGALALFLVIAGGTAYAANTIGSDDIIDGQVKSADIGNNQVQSVDVRDDTLANGGLVGADIADGQLDDEDVGQASLHNIGLDVGLVPIGHCEIFTISGLNAEHDHLLLTPSHADSDPFLDYSINYDAGNEDASLNVCNTTDLDQHDATTHFNLLVFDAQ